MREKKEIFKYFTRFCYCMQFGTFVCVCGMYVCVYNTNYIITKVLALTTDNAKKINNKILIIIIINTLTKT